MSFWSFLKRTLLTSESAVAASALVGEAEEQCTPYDLPIGDKSYPEPWSAHHRGNGHFDVYDAKQQHVAHVHCWDQEDVHALSRRVLTLY